MIDPISEQIIKDILKEKDTRIDSLERQIEALKEYIREETGTLVTNITTTDDEVHIEVEEKPIATPSELNQFEKTIEKYEKYANLFDYGRGEKMAESL